MVYVKNYETVSKFVKCYPYPDTSENCRPFFRTRCISLYGEILISCNYGCLPRDHCNCCCAALRLTCRCIGYKEQWMVVWLLDQYPAFCSLLCAYHVYFSDQ